MRLSGQGRRLARESVDEALKLIGGRLYLGGNAGRRGVLYGEVEP